MRSPIVIIGAGNIGQAIGSLLAGHDVTYWDSAPGKVAHQRPLEEIIEPAQVIFLAVPSNAVRQALHMLRPHLSKSTIVVTVAKGIEPGTLATIDQVLLGSVPPHQPCAHLGGPMLASEIRQGKHSAAAVGSYRRTVFTTLRKLFAKSTLRLEYAADMRGVAVAGVLKNIYTLPLGIAAGLELGNNTVGWLAYCALKEMQTLMPMLGGKRATLMSAAGLGDFIATATSPLSTNYRAGAEIGKTGSTTIASEGLLTLPSLLELLGSYNKKKLPLLSATADIVLRHHDPKTSLAALITN